eukprot:6477463-Amphidinium_carterae.1
MMKDVEVRVRFLHGVTNPASRRDIREMMAVDVTCIKQICGDLRFMSDLSTTGCGEHQELQLATNSPICERRMYKIRGTQDTFTPASAGVARLAHALFTQALLLVSRMAFAHGRKQIPKYGSKK